MEILTLGLGDVLGVLLMLSSLLILLAPRQVADWKLKTIKSKNIITIYRIAGAVILIVGVLLVYFF